MKRAAPLREPPRVESKRSEKERKSELCDVWIEPGKISSLAKATWQSH